MCSQHKWKECALCCEEIGEKYFQTLFASNKRFGIAKLQFCFWLLAKSTVESFPCLATHWRRWESFSLFLFFQLFEISDSLEKSVEEKQMNYKSANMCARAPANETMFTCVKYDNGARATSETRKRPRSTVDLSLRFISAHTCCMHQTQMARNATGAAVNVEFHFQREEMWAHEKKII